ncbi:CYTH and CHAD domain-containing protein [Streptomyces sp. NPDC005840]|jgi:CHAD domain-containing protein|uniref:CYTH and CHAD domain-containing protein n=1 Tax=Streptomyces doudnae TaxID=3075536 RepID=A0ABD5EWQ6_9ACTN|nr:MULTISPECIES: CYTH and CHAD domain-containing protein [unclassified Streptomyces]MDT0439056.1 CYTH and CHAD domain-containing protein [Streptomyces sp. DSM 41981]MYQ63102.1 CHAD domain-containing protein [Streptomyces sp. SID4950]SCD50929.1 CHAD domain-containing protein [Streptomyces sp. SolWspMP-5a-2]
MADKKREIERKYESDYSGLPDLTGVAGVVTVVDRGVVHLDATYYDTADGRLGGAGLTLRRRTGGTDAGWHLKFPVGPGVRDEIHAPLSRTLPHALAALVRSRARDAALLPVVRLRSERDLRHLLDGDGRLLAEVAVDAVRAERLTGDGGEAQWTEIEVELADGGDPAFLDRVEKRLRAAGVRPSAAASKVGRALAETDPDGGRGPERPPAPVTAGDHVLAYVRAQREAILALDPAVRQDTPDSVHRMRVATRRLRSTFRSYPAVLDRAVTDPVAAELKWLAGELGVDRDQEVLTDRIAAALDELPRALLAGPVRSRLRAWSHARRGGSRRRLTAVLDGPRYLELLVALDRLVDGPPLRPAAAKKPAKVLAKAVRKDHRKLSALVAEARELPPGHARDVALHEARKKAKRTRYAAEAAVPALGAPAKALARSAKAVQSLLGDHQDSVMTREALRDLARQAHAAGESTFTYGVLYGREERNAERSEAELPQVWGKVRGVG